MSLLVNINGDSTKFEEKITIRSALEKLQMLDNRGLAVSINEEVIPKSLWNETYLKENDKMIIIKPTAGG